MGRYIYIINNFIQCEERRERLILPRGEREILPSRERVFGDVVVVIETKRGGIVKIRGGVERENFVMLRGGGERESC